MNETRASWGEVGAKVTDLGRKLRTHFDQQRAAGEDEPRQPGPDAAGTATDGGPDPVVAKDTAPGTDGDRVQEAVRKLTDAVDGVVEALGSVVKDPAIKNDLKQVGSALTGAMSASFADISDDLRQAFKRKSNHQDQPTTPTPPTATAADPSTGSASDPPKPEATAP